MLTAQHITVRCGEKTIVRDLSFSLEEGQWLMLLGPNGAGKSTLISALTQGIAYGGQVTCRGRDMRRMKPAQIARCVGVLAQQHRVGYAYTVEEVVNLGRYAHRRKFWSGDDDAQGQERVERALRDTGMEALRGQSLLSLSGGEVQRAFLAQVFAQDPEILLLDEPANHLDLVYQKHIFSLVQSWLQTPGRAVLSVVHDLSLALRYGSHAILMQEGRCAAQGEIRQVLTPEPLRAVYGMDVYAWMREMYGQWTQEGAR